MIRRALLLCSAAALTPPIVLASQAAATPGDLKPRFTPPSEPFILTRTLVRTLHDGKQIVVRRSYSVSFLANGEGFLVNGRQISASVDAPAKLASLAEIERNRVDDGMFPMRLNASGFIASAQTQPGTPSPAIGVAVEQSHRLVDQSALPAAVKPEAHRQINQIAAVGANSGDWPADLFSPLAADRSERRHFDLPGGGAGDVEVVIQVQRSAPDGLPARVERTITTVIGNDSRVSREIWTLGPADG